MQNYYRVLLEIGRKKKEKHERTIFVRTISSNSIDEMLTVVKKIKAAKLIFAQKIDRDDYIAGVSRSIE